MRQVCLDTETTGRSVKDGNRMIEIGCVEVEGLKKTGKTFQAYLNPQCAMEAGAFKVHGISSESLKDKPLFASVAQDFLDFIDGSELVIHNASFDLGFLNYELDLAGLSAITNPVVDTMYVSRRKFPGQSASLDALCKRLGVESAHRVMHGALLDAELLADAFIKLFENDGIVSNFSEALKNFSSSAKRGKREKVTVKTKVIVPTDKEMQNHFSFLEKNNIKVSND